MKHKPRKIKRRKTVRGKKTAMQSFSIRDAWDVIVVVMLLTIIVYFSAYVRNNQFAFAAWPAIKNVSIYGDFDAVDREALKEIIRNHSASGFLYVQMEQLEKELENLTWVRHVSVQRYWPNTLSVNVLQHSPIARWGDTGLMNAYGDLFFPNQIEPYQDLPLLYGEEIRAKQLARTFEESVQQLKLMGLQLRGLFEDERQSKHLVLAGGLVISIGDGEVDEKIDRFIAAYDQFLANKLSEIKKVDLRYTNGLAIEWKSPQYAQNIPQYFSQGLSQHSQTEPNL